MLEKHYKDKGVENLIDKMHVTLIYDPLNDAVKKFKPKSLKNYKCTVVGTKVLGEGKWQAIVLELSCAPLVRRHSAIRKVFDLTHGYPEFNLHCSLKYQPSSKDVGIIMGDKTLHNKTIVFNGEYVEPLTED
jgi:hypothetical protein